MSDFQHPNNQHCSACEPRSQLNPPTYNIPPCPPHYNLYWVLCESFGDDIDELTCPVMDRSTSTKTQSQTLCRGAARTPCSLMSEKLKRWWIFEVQQGHNNTEAIHKKSQSCLHFLRRLRSFGDALESCSTSSTCQWWQLLFTMLLCVRGSSIKASDSKRQNKLLRNAEYVPGTNLGTVEEVTERRVLKKLLAILDNTSHPLCDTLDRLTDPAPVYHRETQVPLAYCHQTM